MVTVALVLITFAVAFVVLWPPNLCLVVLPWIVDHVMAVGAKSYHPGTVHRHDALNAETYTDDREGK